MIYYLLDNFYFKNDDFLKAFKMDVGRKIIQTIIKFKKPDIQIKNGINFLIK